MNEDLAVEKFADGSNIPVMFEELFPLFGRKKLLFNSCSSGTYQQRICFHFFCDSIFQIPNFGGSGKIDTHLAQRSICRDIYHRYCLNADNQYLWSRVRMLHFVEREWDCDVRKWIESYRSTSTLTTFCS